MIEPVIITDEIPGSSEDVISILEGWGFFPFLLRPTEIIKGDIKLSISTTNSYSPRISILHNNGKNIHLDPKSRVYLRRPKYPISTEMGNYSVDTFVTDQYRMALRGLYSMPVIWMNN